MRHLRYMTWLNLECTGRTSAPPAARHQLNSRRPAVRRIVTTLVLTTPVERNAMRRGGREDDAQGLPQNGGSSRDLLQMEMQNHQDLLQTGLAATSCKRRCNIEEIEKFIIQGKRSRTIDCSTQHSMAYRDGPIEVPLIVVNGSRPTEVLAAGAGWRPAITIGDGWRMLEAGHHY